MMVEVPVNSNIASNPVNETDATINFTATV
jgi:hypothetical protein